MPERPIIEFDHRSQDYAHNWIDRLHELRSKCPVGFTHSHDGYWVATRYDDVTEILRDDDTYLSYNDVENDHKGGGGILIPAQQVRSGVVEMDEPAHAFQRDLVLPFFSPARIKAQSEVFLKDTNDAIDAFVEKGECDLVKDFATVVPIKFTARFVGLPMKDLAAYEYVFHAQMYTTPGMPEYAGILKAYGIVRAELVEEIADRRKSPRQDDLITTLIQAEFEGHDENEVINILFSILGGGIDTTTTVLSCALLWLADNPDARNDLAANPKKLPAATEEFLRYFTPIQGIARTLAKDHDLRGCPMAKGDRLYMSLAGANHDPEKFADPDTIKLDRSPDVHQAFGIGAHRCLGMNFARAEFQVMVRELLNRIPDYRVLHNRVVRYPDIGLANGYVSLPVVFTPGPRIG